MKDNLEPNKMSLRLGLLLTAASAFALAGLVHAKHPFFRISREFNLEMGAANEKRLEYEELTRQVNTSNATVVFAMAGSLLAGCLSWMGNPCCSLTTRVLSGLVLGALWGAITGYIATFAEQFIVPRGAFPSATTTGVSQAVAFGLLGGGVGLIFALTSKTMNSVVSNVLRGILNVLKGILGGSLGGFLFPILAGLVATAQNSSNLIPIGFLGLLLWIAIPFATIFYLLTQFGPTHPSIPQQEENKGSA